MIITARITISFPFNDFDKTFVKATRISTIKVINKNERKPINKAKSLLLYLFPIH
jgi:hypothetical protein